MAVGGFTEGLNPPTHANLREIPVYCGLGKSFPQDFAF